MAEARKFVGALSPHMRIRGSLLLQSAPRKRPSKRPTTNSFQPAEHPTTKRMSEIKVIESKMIEVRFRPIRSLRSPVRKTIRAQVNGNIQKAFEVSAVL